MVTSLGMNKHSDDQGWEKPEVRVEDYFEVVSG